MKRFKEKFAEWRKDKLLVRTAIGAASAMLLLIVCLGVALFMRSNIQSRYLRAASGIQEQTFQELIDMTELYERVDEPGVDVQHKLIPELKAEYSAVAALNTALIENFGEDKAVLTAEQTAAFEAAFDEYSSAYRQGLATGLAQTDMTACIAGVQQMISERYAPKVEPTEPVPIIDGASGKIANPQN